MHKALPAFLLALLPVGLFLFSNFDLVNNFSLHALANPILLLRSRFLFVSYAPQNFLNQPVLPAPPSILANLLLIIIFVALCLHTALKD